MSESPSKLTKTWRYDAFISYSHSADSKVAPALQSALQRLATPWYKLRSIRVFRDETDLSATPSLWSTIEAALDTSRYFLLMASPAAAQSKWVRREVRHWLDAGRAAQLFIVLTDGAIVWREQTEEGQRADFDWVQTTALPPDLAAVFDSEPLWVDLRKARRAADFSRSNPEFTKAVAMLSAPIRNQEIEQLVSADYREHRKLVRLAWITLLVLTVLLGLALAQWWRAEARQRDLANSLATRSWENSRTVQERSPLHALHLLAEAAEVVQDADLRASVSLAYSARLPRLLLKAILVGKTPLRGTAFSPDGSQFLTYSAEGDLQVWNAHTGEPTGMHVEVAGELRGAIFNHSGSHILAWNADGTARLWNSLNGEQAGAVMKHTAAIRGALFNPDDSLILTWSEDNTARLWHTTSGEPFGSPLRHAGPLWYAAFNRDGGRIVTVGEDGVARLWRTAATTQVGADLQQERSIWGALFDPDGRRVVTWSHRIQLWNVVTGQRIGPSLVNDQRVTGAIFSPDGSRILTWSEDGSARLWDLTTGKQIGAELPHGPLPFHVAHFNHAGTQILTYGSDGGIRLWEANTGNLRWLASAHDGYVNGAAFTQDDSQLLTWSSDGTARLWDADSGQQISPELQHSGAVWDALFNADESQLLTWSADGAVRLWDVAAETSFGPTFTHDGPVLGAVLSRDERRVLTWSQDGTARLWGVTSGYEFTIAQEGIRAAMLNASQTRILTWDILSAHLWDAATGKPVNTLGHWGTILGAQFTATGDRLLTWSADDTVRLWAAETGKELIPALSHHAEFVGAAFAHNEERILTWSADGAVRFWDASTGQQLAPTFRHGESLLGATLSSDEKRLFTWGTDGFVRQWDAETAVEIMPSLQHGEWLQHVLFNQAGDRILTWGSGGIIGYARLWGTQAGQQVASALTDLTGVRAASFSSSGDRLLIWNLTGNVHTTTVWEAATGAHVGPELKHGDNLKGAILNRQGNRLLTWNDRILRLWDVATGNPVGPAFKQSGAIVGAQFTSDEAQILAWSDDGVVRLWKMPGDLDFPATMFKLEAMTLTGANFDPLTSVVAAIPPTEWQKLRQEYLTLARNHARDCTYATRNVYLTRLTMDEQADAQRWTAAPSPAPTSPEPPVDLQIVKVDFVPFNQPPFTHDLHVTARNAGPGVAKGFDGVCRYDCIGGTVISDGATFVQGGYIGGDSEFTYQTPFRLSCTVAQPAITLACDIDPDHQVQEINEDNNHFSVELNP